MPRSINPVAGAMRLAAWTAAFAALLFAAAGTIAWPAAWAYLAIISTITVVHAAIVVRLHPGLVEERLRPPSDAKRWDKPLVAIVAVFGPMALMVLCGLDRRFGWSGAAAASVEAAGLAAVAAGGGVSLWAVASNPFFSGLVRVQRDRGHHVVDTGPYRIVRHPSYAGSMVYMIGVTVALGSYVALAVAAALCAVLAVRTALEDRVLQGELEGYADYARRVRFRILPGVW
jgi:protein-S-isoprenylcysteine O-methyltransferase Ste14